MPTIAACPFLSVVHKQLLISLTLLDIVGGIPTPLKNDGVRQLGWWHSPIWWESWKVIIQSMVPNHQPAILVASRFPPNIALGCWMWRLRTSKNHKRTSKSRMIKLIKFLLYNVYIYIYIDVVINWQWRPQFWHSHPILSYNGLSLKRAPKTCSPFKGRFFSHFQTRHFPKYWVGSYPQFLLVLNVGNFREWSTG